MYADAAGYCTGLENEMGMSKHMIMHTNATCAN